MNTYKILAIFGMISPILYTLLWVIAGFIVPGYNHIRDDVSSLYAVNAYMRWFFQTGFLIGSIFLLIFYMGLHKGITSGEGSIIGPVLMLISSFMGVVVTSFFPLDEGGEITTWRGKGHFVLIIISGVISLAGMVFLWLRARNVEGWTGFGWFSLVSAIGGLILVVISGIYAGSDVMGLIERFMVTWYQIFYFVIALIVYLKN